MTAIVTGPLGRPYRHRLVEREEVFVAEQPGGRPADYAPHLGHATLVAMMDPIEAGDAALAVVRLADGRVTPVRATALCPAAPVAARRILPPLHRYLAGIA